MLRMQVKAACKKRNSVAIFLQKSCSKKRKKKIGNDCLQPRTLTETLPFPFEWVVGPSNLIETFITFSRWPGLKLPGWMDG